MTNRPAPPDLEFSHPPCPLCFEETEMDGDELDCFSCQAMWDWNGLHGAWMDDKAEQCDSVSRVFAGDRCWLDFGHEGKHRSSIFDWSA